MIRSIYHHRQCKVYKYIVGIIELVYNMLGIGKWIVHTHVCSRDNVVYPLSSCLRSQGMNIVCVLHNNHLNSAGHSEYSITYTIIQFRTDLACYCICRAPVVGVIVQLYRLK